MRLNELVAGVPGAAFDGDGDVEITGVEYDSRRVKAGDLFVERGRLVPAERLQPCCDRAPLVPQGLRGKPEPARAVAGGQMPESRGKQRQEEYAFENDSAKS